MWFRASRDDTLRALYGDLAPAAVIHGENSPTPGGMDECPGRDLRVHAGDWTVVIGTGDELTARGTKVPRPRGSGSLSLALRRIADPGRALRSDMNPAFYPTMAALLALVISSASVLHFNYRPLMTWVDALYFTAETITTTGYGDFSFVHQRTCCDCSLPR